MVQSTPHRSIQQLRQHDFDHPRLNSGYQIMTIPLSPLSFRFDLIFIALMLTLSRLPPSTDTQKPHPRRLQTAEIFILTMQKIWNARTCKKH